MVWRWRLKHLTREAAPPTPSTSQNEAISVENASIKGDVVECYIDAPEDVKWKVQINNTTVSGTKNITTGDRLELIIYIDLCSEKVWLEKQTKEQSLDR